MEVSRLRLLFLIALAATTLPGCALFRRGAPAGTEPVAEAGAPVQQATPAPVTGINLTKMALTPAERQLALGSVSHNHVDLRGIAIDALLEVGDLDGVERNCVRIESYTAQEPLPLHDWIVRRGRALARVARGERDDALAASLRALHDEGTRAELKVLLPALDRAIARVGAASAG